MSKLMISQALLWAAAILVSAILVSAISASDSWWLIPILATVALGNLKNEIRKL
jgi:hypothetical protein